MKYERIERTLEETIESCDKLGWSIAPREFDLLLGRIEVDEYIKSYSASTDRPKLFVNFFFKKVEEFEKGQWYYFWDNDKYSGCIRQYECYINGDKLAYNDSEGCGWLNCISIEEYKEWINNDIL